MRNSELEKRRAEGGKKNIPVRKLKLAHLNRKKSE